MVCLAAWRGWFLRIVGLRFAQPNLRLDAVELHTAKSPASAGLCFLQRQRLADTAGAYVVCTTFGYAVGTYVISTIFSYTVCTYVISTIFGYTVGTYVISTIFGYAVGTYVIRTIFGYAVGTYVISTIFSYTVGTGTVSTAFSYTVGTAAISTAFGYTVCAGTVSATFCDYRGIQLLVQVGGVNGYCASGQYGKGQAEDQFVGFHDGRSRSLF